MRNVLLCICVLMLSVSVVNSDATGRIRGKVTDPSGKGVSSVAVQIEFQGELQRSYTAHTNDKGEYSHIGIMPGKYRITVSKEGYQATDFAERNIPAGDRPEVVDFKIVPPQPQKDLKQEEEQGAAAKAGIAFLKEGKFDEAIASFRKALEKDPSSAAIYYNLGAAYERKDQMEEARKHYREAADLKPDFGEAYLAIGNSYLSERDFGSAAADALNKAADLLPDNYAAHYNLGICYWNAGKFAEAEVSFRKAAEIDPKEPVVRYQLGMALLGQSKNQEAKQALQKYLELNPNAADRADVETLLKSLE